MLARAIIAPIAGEAKRFIKSSSSETKNWVSPGSPWRPERPRSWLSMRRGGGGAGRRGEEPALRRHRRPLLGIVRHAAELDVDAAAGHVRCDGDRPLPPSRGDDLGFALVVLGVEHLVRHTLRFQQGRERLGLLD